MFDLQSEETLNLIQETISKIRQKDAQLFLIGNKKDTVSTPE